jgi:hypothetical protein
MELGESHLPHALPWDEISPLAVSREIDVEPFLPPLRDRSLTRIAHDPDFQKLAQAIQDYGEQRKRSELPLRKDDRIELQKQEEEWSKRIKELNFRRTRRRQAGSKAAAPDSPPNDLVMDEACRVLADLIVLRKGGTLSAAIDVSRSTPGLPPRVLAPVVPETAGKNVQ